MKRTIVSMLALTALAAITGPIHAQDAADSSIRLQRLVTRFHKADVNGDGQLTREEAHHVMPLVYTHFSEIDRENKGYVTLAQVASFLEAHPELARVRHDTSTPPATPPADQ